MRIDYTHPRFRDINDFCVERFHQEFNSIPLSLVEKAYPDLYEYTVTPHDYYEGDDDPEPLYPMWDTVFEANDTYLNDKLLGLVEELAEIGLYLLDGFDELNCCVFVQGGGYDFYEAHWIPMFQLLGWIPERLLEEQDEGTASLDRGEQTI